MVTIKDIAKESGVGVGTVSRVLNGGGYVSPEKTQAVWETVETLGYEHRPKQSASRNEKRRESQGGRILFLAIFAHSPREIFQQPALPVLLDGIHQEMERHGLELVFGHSPDGKSLPPVLAGNNADGVLLFGNQKPKDALRQALKKVPSVWCFRGFGADPERCFDHVFFDNSHVGELAAQYLLGRGHRNLAFVNLCPPHLAFQHRRDQFIQAARQRGANVKVLETKNDDTFKSQLFLSETLVKKLVKMEPLPDAVFLPADDQVLTFYHSLRHHGIEPERDLTLLGCNNDTMFLSRMHPRPATIDIKLDTVGQKAAERLLWLMKHPDDENRVEMLINPVVASGEKEDRTSEIKEAAQASVPVI